MSFFLSCLMGACLGGLVARGIITGDVLTTVYSAVGWVTFIAYLIATRSRVN